MTGGEGAHIVCDMLRGPVFAAGLAALARCGVNVSSGWQLDKKIAYDSAGLSVRQITLDHMHYETIDGCNAATTLYGSVFKPTVHSRDLPLRGSAALLRRAAAQRADRHPDRAGRARTARRRSLPDPAPESARPPLARARRGGLARFKRLI